MMAPPEKSTVVRGIYLLIVLVLAALMAQFSWSYGPDVNYRNVTANTEVNITGSTPFVYFISQQAAITLNAGSTTMVSCNASVRDYNGFIDIKTVNATFFRSNTPFAAADDNNTHYTNTSCEVISGQQSGTDANYTCTFAVQYYASNGTWNCTIDVNDTIALSNTLSNSTTVNALLALNVTELINFGNISTGQFSDNQTANITNLGNNNINVTVQGYGRNIGDGLAFACEFGNLTANTAHFAANSTASYFEKQNLSSSRTQIFGLTINKTTVPTVSLNTTWWELYINPNQVASGQCNGTIIFQAELSR